MGVCLISVGGNDLPAKRIPKRNEERLEGIYKEEEMMWNADKESVQSSTFVVGNAPTKIHRRKHTIELSRGISEEKS